MLVRVASGVNRSFMLSCVGQERFIVEDQTIIACDSAADVLAVFAEGTRKRTVGYHAMNRSSSRSHSIFTIYVAHDGGDNDDRARGDDAVDNDDGSSIGLSPARRQELMDDRRAKFGAGKPSMKIGNAGGTPGDTNAFSATPLVARREGKISFVDLAGSEDLRKTKTGMMIVDPYKTYVRIAVTFFTTCS